MSVGFWQIVIIVLVIVLLFGAGRVPRLMEDLGKGINAFKRGIKGGDEETPPPAKIEKKDDQMGG